MRKILPFLLLSLILTACTSDVVMSDGQVEDCIGVAEDANPNVRYEVDGGNIAVAVIFSETIVVPLVVVLSEYKCPASYIVPPTPVVPSEPTIRGT